jgi:hypothetical protein
MSSTYTPGERITRIPRVLRIGEPPVGTLPMGLRSDPPLVMHVRDGTGWVDSPETADLVTEYLRSRDHREVADGEYIRRLSEIDRSPAPPLLLDRLDPLGPSMLYGPGDIGKGTTASAWATRLTQAGMNVLILDYEDHPEEWARRIWGLGGEDVTDRIVHVSPLRQWGGPIWAHADRIRDLAEEEGRDYVIIDSVAFAAVGGDVSSPGAPTNYGSALQGIGLPSLSLGHVNRAHDARYPFGSVFWHNTMRITWSLMPKGDERILVSRKANNYAKPPASSIDFTWWEGDLREVSETPAVWTLLDRIAEALAVIDAGTPTDIADTLNEGVEEGEQTSRQTVAATLSRDLKRNGETSRFTVGGGQWTLRRA